MSSITFVSNNVCTISNYRYDKEYHSLFPVIKLDLELMRFIIHTAGLFIKSMDFSIIEELPGFYDLIMRNNKKYCAIMTDLVEQIEDQLAQRVSYEINKDKNISKSSMKMIIDSFTEYMRKRWTEMIEFRFAHEYDQIGG